MSDSSPLIVAHSASVIANDQAHPACAMPKLNTAELEALYAKDTDKLALLAQKLQVSKQQDLIAQKTAEAGDVNSKMEALVADIEVLSAEHRALKDSYDEEYAAWRVKLMRYESLLSGSGGSEDLAALIDALKSEIATALPAPLATKLAVVERQSVLETKEREKSKILENMNMISELKKELSVLEDIVANGQKVLLVKWGEPGHEQEIAELKQQLREAIDAKNAAVKDLKDNAPFIADGIAIRTRKFEWSREGKLQDGKRVDMGDKASHYGSVLADARLVLRDPNDRLPWFIANYVFNPALVLSFEDCTKFVDILDWRAAFLNFRKDRGLVGTKFDLLFGQIMTLSHIDRYMDKSQRLNPISPLLTVSATQLKLK